jgi:hypothetical protein
LKGVIMIKIVNKKIYERDMGLLMINKNLVYVQKKEIEELKKELKRIKKINKKLRKRGIII